MILMKIRMVKMKMKKKTMIIKWGQGVIIPCFINYFVKERFI